jgi:hypothetical protein
MGLDNKYSPCLNVYMTRLPQHRLGSESLWKAFSRGLASLLGRGRVERQSPLAAERIRFEKEVHEQFVQLKKKGLSIPVFTL